MLTIGDLFNRYLSLRKKGHESTFYSVLATGAIGMILALITGLVFGAIQFALMLSFDLKATPSSTYQVFTSFVITMRYLFSYFIGAFTSVAVAYTAIQFISLKKREMGELVKEAYQFSLSGKGLIIGFLFSILHGIAALGYVLLIIPGIIATAAVSLGLLYSIDTDTPLLESIKLGFHSLKGNTINASIFFFLGEFAIISASLLTCGILGLFISSAVILLYATYYASINNKPIFDTPLNEEAANTQELSF